MFRFLSSLISERFIEAMRAGHCVSDPYIPRKERALIERCDQQDAEIKQLRRAILDARGKILTIIDYDVRGGNLPEPVIDMARDAQEILSDAS